MWTAAGLLAWFLAGGSAALLLCAAIARADDEEVPGDYFEPLHLI